MSTQDQNQNIPADALNDKKNKRKFNNPAMRDKLEQMFNRVPPALEQEDKLRTINVNRIGTDGQDHILLDFYGKTEVGKLLAMNMRARFDHPILGNFTSFKGMWYFLNSYERDDRMRDLTGMALENFNRMMTPVHVPNVAAIVLSMLYKRLQGDKHALALISESRSPFDCYWTNEAGLRRRHRWAYWLVPGAEEIRRAIQARTAPDFSSFIEQLNPNETLDQYIAREFLDPQQREIAAKNKELKKEKKAADLLTARKSRHQGPSRKELQHLDKVIAEENPNPEVFDEEDPFLSELGPADLETFAKTIEQEEIQTEQQDKVQSEISEESSTQAPQLADETTVETADLLEPILRGYIQAQEKARLEDDTSRTAQSLTDAG